jgi:hypothetical protein
MAELSWERRTLGAVWVLGLLGLLLGFAAHPGATTTPAPAAQLLDVARIALTTALAATIVMGPGIALRAVWRPHLPLGFVPLPGLAVLAAVGLLAWCLGLAGWHHPRVFSALVILATMLPLPAVIVRSGNHELLTADEWWAVGLIGAALGIAVGRSLWSLGPLGELYGGSIYRTLEVGTRSDSRISYHVVELIAHGNSPWGPVATSYFSPYSFSSRGPLSGLASAPLVLAGGGTPPLVVGSPPWTPFDVEGFMAYRIAMMLFASTSFLSVWSLARRLGGVRAARLAVLLAVTTPFLVHEIWFTWPKLLAASMVLLALLCLLDGRWLQAGLLTGVGYLVHPLALLSIPMLLLIALWPLRGATLRRPQIRPAVVTLVGIAILFVAWRLINGPHYTQGGFMSYVTQAGTYDTLKAIPVTLGAWISDRLISLGNTLVPLRLFLLSGQDQELNVWQTACSPFCQGGSPGIIHFFFQYWCTVPFGLGIAFFPLLIRSLWGALRRWLWPVVATVVVPFVVFWIYWGSASTGLLREGLQTWVLTLVIVVALVQAADGFGWLRSRVVLTVLSTRVCEILLLAMLPTLATDDRLVSSRFWLSDVVALIIMIVPACYLVFAIWRERQALLDTPHRWLGARTNS